RSDQDWQSDGRVAIHVSCERTASQLSVHQRFIKRNRAGTTAGVRGIGGKVNGILVTVNLLLEDVRRHFSLAQKALGDAAADIDHAGDPGANRYLGHVQHVLHDVELKVI